MDEAHFELAQRVTELRRDAALAEAQRAVSGNGQADCEDCGGPIPARRRLALPSCIRCVECQSALEKTNRSTR